MTTVKGGSKIINRFYRISLDSPGNYLVGSWLAISRGRSMANDWNMCRYELS